MPLASSTGYHIGGRGGALSDVASVDVVVVALAKLLSSVMSVDDSVAGEEDVSVGSASVDDVDDDDEEVVASVVVSPPSPPPSMGMGHRSMISRDVACGHSKIIDWAAFGQLEINVGISMSLREI